MEPVIKKNFKFKWILLIAAIILITTMITLMVIGAFMLNQKTIYKNVYIESVDVSRLSKEEANKKITEILNSEIDNHQLELKHNEKIWIIPYSNIGYRYNYDEAVEKAFSVGRKGSIWNRIKEINSTRNKPLFISLSSSYEGAKLQPLINEIRKEIEREPIDASITRINGSFRVKEEILGHKLLEEQLLKLMEDRIEGFSSEPIKIPTEIIEPQLTSIQLDEIKDVLGEFQTTFNPSSEGRATNIRLASESINNRLLMPNEGFSFNEATGPRGLEEGYQIAPVILNGKLVPGIGGGICQVSTTLYNALVRADLEVVRRQNHSLPVAYVPLGHDATVADGYIDLQFINNKEYPIYLVSYTEGDQLYVGVYGKRTDHVTISLDSKVVGVIEPQIEVRKDPNLTAGERRVEREAKRGYRVTTFKVYYRDSKEIKREEISTDYYRPVKGIVAEGIAPTVGENSNSNTEGGGEEAAEETIEEEPPTEPSPDEATGIPEEAIDEDSSAGESTQGEAKPQVPSIGQ
ncbi:VanW family protein [Alkaliphilus serpentinus]|uniref:VanW family protein n=1 Tax=Alkaliphilus serpentinus TaxID=1482731 RepID=UPI0018658946|nr:VanW family protein [Alkaliphilus serpentinus]